MPGVEVGIGTIAGCHNVNVISSSWDILTSGLTSYRRGLNNTGQYVLDYSNDGGVTWETLVSLGPSEDTVIQDKTNIYRHQIRGTAYKVDFTLTPLGFLGEEDMDWINIYST